VAAGRGYEQYVREEILAPLGMTRSAFWYDALPLETAVARGSHPNDFMGLVAHFMIDMDKAVHPTPGARYWFNRFYPDQTGPSGLLGTASDLARFGSMIAQGGQLDGVRVLSEDSVRVMTKPRAPVVESPAEGGPYSFGLGWFVSKDPHGRVLLEHGGSGMGFVSRLTVRPADGRVAAVVGNDTYLDGAGGGAISAALLAMALDDP
jgi:CubicO group peptidase (beta-lactamase class C family)